MESSQAKDLGKMVYITLNQRVQGSSPYAPTNQPLKFQHEILERGSSSVRSEAKGSKGVPTFARVARERARRGECTRLTLGSPGLSEAGE